MEQLLNTRQLVLQSIEVVERGRGSGDRTGGGRGDRGTFQVAERGRGSEDRTGGGGGDRHCLGS